MTLEKKDYMIILSAFTLLLIASTVSMILGASIQVEALVDLASALVIFASLYYVHLGVDLAGGTVGRAMTLVAVGVGYYGIYILPHLYFHITSPETIGPLNAQSVEIFFHTSTSMVFFVIAWGFYNLYRGAKQ